MNSKGAVEDPSLSRLGVASRSEEREVILAAMVLARGLSALLPFVLIRDPLAMAFFPLTEEANFLKPWLIGFGLLLLQIGRAHV